MEDKVKAALVLGILIRVIFWHVTPVTGDGALHLSIIKFMGDNLAIPVFEEAAGPNPYWYPPLFHLLSAGIYLLTGEPRLSTLVFGVLGLFAFYRFTGEHFKKHSAAATAALALLPFHIYYSAISYPDSLLFLLSVLAFDRYLTHLRDGKRKSLVDAAILSSLAASTHYNGLVVLAAVGAHLLVRNRRKALAFLVLGALLSSPWYARNYAVFGNPIWPKLGGGLYPDDSAVQELPPVDAALNLINPVRWVGTYLDFLIGAPNSGEDFFDNIERAGNRIPFAQAAALLWVLAALYLTYCLIAGLRGISKEALLLLACALAFGLPFYSGNGLARMFTPAIVFVPLMLASGAKKATRQLLLWVALTALLAGSLAYALVYDDMRGGYAPFFDMMKEGIGPGERVLMPYNVGECLYFTERKCARIGSAGGVPIVLEGELEASLLENGIEYVCCTSINHEALSGYNRMVCEHYIGEPPIFSHINGNVWGRCWRT